MVLDGNKGWCAEAEAGDHSTIVSQDDKEPSSLVVAMDRKNLETFGDNL